MKKRSKSSNRVARPAANLLKPLVPRLSVSRHSTARPEIRINRNKFYQQLPCSTGVAFMREYFDGSLREAAQYVLSLTREQSHQIAEARAVVGYTLWLVRKLVDSGDISPDSSLARLRAARIGTTRAGIPDAEDQHQLERNLLIRLLDCITPGWTV